MRTPPSPGKGQPVPAGPPIFDDADTGAIPADARIDEVKRGVACAEVDCDSGWGAYLSSRDPTDSFSLTGIARADSSLLDCLSTPLTIAFWVRRLLGAQGAPFSTPPARKCGPVAAGPLLYYSQA